MKYIKLKIKKRNKTGTNYNKKIRKKDKIPAIIYGKNKKNILLKINHNYIYNIIKKYQVKTKINDIKFLIKINKKKIISNIKNIQKHPYKNKILHIDFIYK